MRMLVAVCLAVAAWSEDRLALEGFDPVLLTEGRDADGREALQAAHRGFLYYFASEETRARFLKEPDRYGIQLGGACARMGAPTAGDPAAYHVYEGRIYIFGSSNCYQLFKQNTAKYVEREADRLEWRPTPAATEQAAALWRRMLEAMGGAGRWRAVTGLVEKRAGQVRTFRGTDAARVDRGTPERMFSQVVTDNEVYTVFQGQVARTAPAMQAGARAVLAVELFPLLRGADPEMYATGERDGLNWLRLRRRGMVLDAGIDAASGRLVRIAYGGRGPGGETGRIEIVYSDFRAVDGLLLPYRADGALNGAKVDGVGGVIEAYELNPPDLEVRFTPPVERKN